MTNLDDVDLKNAIPFVAKIAKQGDDSRIITVPKRLWETGIIDENKIYTVYLLDTGKKKRTKE